MRKPYFDEVENDGRFVRNWFSNMIPFEKPLEYEGILYGTPEHFYQAMKTTDREGRWLVANCKSGPQAKRAGRKILLRPDWDAVKLKIMLMAQEYRFAEGTQLHDKLLHTPRDIVEWNNWHDLFWGDCICPKCRDLEGKNCLGKMITEIRDGYLEVKEDE